MTSASSAGVDWRAAGELGALAADALAAICRAGRADLGALWAITHDEDDPPRLLAASGLGDAAALTRLRPGLGLAGRAYAEAAPLEEGPEGAELGRGEAAGGPRARRELDTPLLHGGRVLGVAAIGWHDAAPPTRTARAALERELGRAEVELGHAIALATARRQTGITRAVLDASPDGVLLVDDDGAAVLASRGLHARLGALVPSEGESAYRQAELFAAGVRDPEALRAALREIERRPGLETVFGYELAGGQSFTCYTAPVRTSWGESLGRVFIHREVTAEREGERLRDEFLALVSHELRTPLTSIIGYLDVLLEGEAGELDAEQRRFLGIARRNASRLVRLVGDLIVVAQAEAGQLRLSRGALDLARAAADCIDGARPQAIERGVTLELSTAGAAPLSADSERIGQVLDNLVANAIKFTPEGGRVSVGVATEGGRAVLEVVDDGPGIPEEERERVFERFFRSSRARAEEVPGTGLGLAISRAIVEAHGGRIGVAATRGRGATFRVELPLAAGSPASDRRGLAGSSD